MRRCNTLVQLIVRELDPEDAEELMRKRVVRNNNKKEGEGDEAEAPTAVPQSSNHLDSSTNGKDGIGGGAQSKGRKRKTEEVNLNGSGGGGTEVEDSGNSTPNVKKRTRTKS